jgi:hypothetical protein
MAQETRQFLSRGSVKCNMLAYSMFCCHNGWGLPSTPLKWSKDQTWVPQFFFISQHPICEESPQVGVYHALHNMITIKTGVGGVRICTQEHNTAKTRTKANKRAQDHKDRVTTQKCAQISLKHKIAWSQSLGVVECLVYSSMAPMGSFCSPKGLGDVGALFGSSQPSSFRGCTRLLGAHHTTLAQQPHNRRLTAFPLEWAQTVRWGHRTVRWPIGPFTSPTWHH